MYITVMKRSAKHGVIQTTIPVEHKDEYISMGFVDHVDKLPAEKIPESGKKMTAKRGNKRHVSN